MFASIKRRTLGLRIVLALALAAVALVPATGVSAATPTISVSQVGAGFHVTGQGYPDNVPVWLSYYNPKSESFEALPYSPVTTQRDKLLYPCSTGLCSIANPLAGTFTWSSYYWPCENPKTVMVRAQYNVFVDLYPPNYPSPHPLTAVPQYQYASGSSGCGQAPPN
jgi:hypothetical protein